MQTKNSRYQGAGIKPLKPTIDRDQLRRNVSDRVTAAKPQQQQAQEFTYNQQNGQSHAQQVRQAAARIGVANENKFAQTSQKVKHKTVENLTYSKNIFKGAALLFWRPIAEFFGFFKRRYTHLSLKFEQTNLFNTSLHSFVNSALVIILIITASILYRNGQIATIKQTVIEKMGEWSGAAGVNVQEVKLYNRQHTSKAEILAALNVEIGTPLLSFDVDAARLRIEQIGWVAEAKVQRILPDRLEISIVERDPFAIWQIEGKRKLVDGQGVVVADKVLRGYHLLPLIVGKGAATEALGLLTALEERPEIFEYIRALVRVGERRWDLDLTNGVRVLLPAEKPEAMLADLERMILDQNIFSRGIKLIDFRLNDRVRFEMDEVTANAYFDAKQAAAKDKK